jgi:hypothetical protein
MLFEPVGKGRNRDIETECPRIAYYGREVFEQV